MCKGLEQPFGKRRHTNGQQVHEQELKITNYQGRANKNHNEILPHTYQNGCYKKRQEITRAGEDVEKRKPSDTVGENVKW